MPAETRLIPCLDDNYAVLIHDPATGATALVDAPEEAPVMTALADTGWTLSDILITHHHADHTQALAAIKRATGARVVGPRAEASKIAGLDETVAAGDTVTVGSMTAGVIETPGHTRGHVVFHFAGEKILFAGDTLFVMGCGRLLEAGPEAMWPSLKKIKALPADTTVFVGHEYTASNARFAAGIEPGNAALLARLADVEARRGRGEPTVPTTLAEEFATNPFLRADEASVAEGVGMAGADPQAVFAEVRARKDRG